MAKPIHFPEANFTLLGGDTGAQDLHCFKGQGQFISCWELSAEEAAEVAKTGRVWVSVSGTVSAPPVLILGKSPMISAEELERDYFPVIVDARGVKPFVNYVPNRLKEEFDNEYNELTQTKEGVLIDGVVVVQHLWLLNFFAKHSE